MTTLSEKRKKLRSIIAKERIVKGDSIVIFTYGLGSIGHGIWFVRLEKYNLVIKRIPEGCDPMDVLRGKALEKIRIKIQRILTMERTAKIVTPPEEL